MSSKQQATLSFWQQHLVAWLGLLLVILLFTGQALLPGRVLLPLDVVVQLWPPWQQPNQTITVHNPLLTDVIDYIYPVKTWVAEQLRSGVLPLWNPYVLGGYPLTYNTQAAPWYPLTLLYLFLPGPTAVNSTILLQLLLGGLFMLAYLRLLGLRSAAAWLGSILFLFNGMMIVWLEWQVVHAAVIWLPLQLYFVEKLGKTAVKAGEKWGKWAVGAGIAFALPWLGGHWNWALYGSMTTAVYALWRLPWQQQRGRAMLFSTFAIGIGLSAIQVLPAFAYLSQGHRRPFTFAESLQLGLKNRAIVALLPDFFGNPIHWNWDGPTNYNETAFYLGILPLFLLAAGLVWGWQRRPVRFFAAWGGLTWLWALGTPAYGLLYLLPVFNGLWPSRAITAVLFCASVLAAFGLDVLLAAPRPRLGQLLLAVTAVIVAIVVGYLWFYQPDTTTQSGDWGWLLLSLLVSLLLLTLWGRGWLGKRPFVALLLLWVVADLLWAGYDYNTVGNVADLYPSTPTSQFLQSDPELGRMTTLPEGVAYPPNSNLQARLQALSGYEPAILQTWVDYVSAAEGATAIYFERELMPLHGLGSPLLDAVNLKYVVTIAEQFGEQAALGEAAETVAMWQPLAAGEGAERPFSVPDAGLHRIDLPLQPTANADGKVVVRLFAPDGGQEFANATWETGQPLDDGWASFFFGAFPSEWGRSFLLTAVYEGSGELALGYAPDGLAFRSYYLPRPHLVHESGKTRVYLNEGYFPRAYLVGQALAASDAAAALMLVQANSNRLAELVVLETDAPPQPNSSGAIGSVDITTYALNEVELTADLTAPGYLVLADSYYPGWRATVDGVETAVYRANSVVRAIALPAGHYDITFTFQPLDFYLGTAITALALLAAGVVWIKQ